MVQNQNRSNVPPILRMITSRISGIRSSVIKTVEYLVRSLVLNDLLKSTNSKNQKKSGNYKHNIYDIVKLDKEEIEDSFLEVFRKWACLQKEITC